MCVVRRKFITTKQAVNQARGISPLAGAARDANASPCGRRSNNESSRHRVEIRAQQLELREDVEAGRGMFEGMTAIDRRELVERQTRLLTMIEGKETVQDLDDNAQVEAFNLLQEISTAITQAEGEQVVCQSVQRTGSHRREKRCTTVAERRQEREEAQRALDKAMTGFGPLKP